MFWGLVLGDSGVGVDFFDFADYSMEEVLVLSFVMP
jgi:hypothetical protein